MAGDSEVFAVLGRDVGWEQWSRVLWSWYWTIWMISFPLIIVLTILGVRSAYLGICPLAYGGLFLALFSFFRLFVKSELLLDQERQELMIRQRRFFFFVSHQPLMGAEELWGTTWAGELPQAPFTWWWEYTALILTRQGRRFRASRSLDWAEVDGKARALAAQLGLPFHAGQPEHRLSLAAGPQLRFKKVPVAGLDLFSLLYWGLLIIPGCICMFLGLLLPFSRG